MLRYNKQNKENNTKCFIYTNILGPPILSQNVFVVSYAFNQIF